MPKLSLKYILGCLLIYAELILVGLRNYVCTDVIEKWEWLIIIAGGISERPRKQGDRFSLRECGDAILSGCSRRGIVNLIYWISAESLLLAFFCFFDGVKVNFNVGNLVVLF